MLDYDKIEVKSGGIYAGGDPKEKDRVPSIIEVRGPRRMTVDFGKTSVNIDYEVITDDLRREFQITWSVDGAIVGGVTGEIKRRITFNCEGATFDVPISRTLNVKVTDADALEATHEITVEIYSRRPVDPDDDGLPPICKIRPWLRQCKPDEPA